ncbi:ankyrin repeat-containing protein NPR4 [Daucus carota subsp. sativus]|nr:PREDICTED: uncharacterized protein LOC108214961 [Daucus carota subsp. sativus]XP_017242724.1 PREDICTED: uncharacterized protein LOC108214961 [Daucus carota subsp. sativus]
MTEVSDNSEIEGNLHHFIEMPQQSQPRPRPRPRRPSSFYLSDAQRENYLKICVPLYNAALDGDWHAAEEIITDCPEVINMSITKKEDTLLHVVSSTGRTHFAEKVVNMMTDEDLELQNKDGETALCVAVASTVKMVDILLARNSRLLEIRKKGGLPILCAIWCGDKNMVAHMYSKINLADKKWTQSDRRNILNSCLAIGLFDIAHKILIHYKKEGILKVDTRVLRYLAYKLSAFDETAQPFIRRLINTILPGPRLGPTDNSKAAEIVRIMWGEIIKQKHEDVLKQIAGDPNRAIVEGLLFTAARFGNHKFLVELLRMYPDVTWDTDDNKHTIFHVAVINRHENVYNLLYGFGSKKLEKTDKDGNNILHLAAIKPTQTRLNIVSGAALQMQRELLWFKEVKTRLNSVDRRKKNNQGKNPKQLFTDEHAKLMEKGESWMKQTAAQCMVVAALIATITFAAAFTLPGGSNCDSGHPVLMKSSAFVVFVVTDAISLCTSSASILVFLAILTARYTEYDFLASLPVKLMVGLLTLFISIATMMIAFSASFFLLYAKSMKWIPILVATLAGLPVILFAWLHYRLFFDVINTTYSARYLFRPKKRIFG